MLSRSRRQQIDRLMAAALLTAVGDALSTGRFRILAYHVVDDVARFRTQIAYLAGRYTPVGPASVISALNGEPLPPRAVWVTFDDGDPSVVERGVPVLSHYQVPSTMFLCPSVVDAEIPLWWQRVEQAVARGATVRLGEATYGGPQVAALLARLKSMPDSRKNGIVEAIERQVAPSGGPLVRRQVTLAQVASFVAAGGTVGNHTWSHSCLDRCRPQDVEHEILAGRDWIDEHFPGMPRLLAYPNGNWTPVAEQVLQQAGYQVGLLFDHRLASRHSHPLRLSRLRVNAADSIERFRAVLSGVHPTVHRVRTLLTRRNRPA